MQRWLIAVQQGRDPTQLLSEVKSEFRLVICRAAVARHTRRTHSSAAAQFHRRSKVSSDA